MVLLEEQSDIAYFFNAAEEEENKEEGKEKDMKETFMSPFQELELSYFFMDEEPYFHLHPEGYDVFFVPVLPPPEHLS